MIIPSEIKLKLHNFFFQTKDSLRSLKLVEDFSNLVLDNKPEIYDATLPNAKIINNSKVPYYLQHSDLLENSKKIFVMCFGQ